MPAGTTARSRVDGVVLRCMSARRRRLPGYLRGRRGRRREAAASILDTDRRYRVLCGSWTRRRRPRSSFEFAAAAQGGSLAGGAAVTGAPRSTGSRTDRPRARGDRSDHRPALAHAPRPPRPARAASRPPPPKPGRGAAAAVCRSRGARRGPRVTGASDRDAGDNARGLRTTGGRPPCNNATRERCCRPAVFTVARG